VAQPLQADAIEMPSPPLRFLKTFQLAALRGSFKAAADELCVTASAVSHQIKTLEDQLGLVLFIRQSRSLTLTPAGTWYLHHIEAAFGRLESATEQLRSRFTREVVRLRVPPFFASEMLLPRLARFSALHAETDIRIATHDSSSDVHRADCDVSIIVGDGRWDDVRATQLLMQSYVPACAPSLLQGRTLDEAQIAREPLIVQGRRPDLWDRWAGMVGIRLLQPRQLIHVETMSAAVNAAEQGVGIALVSVPLTESRFLTGTLLRLSRHELQMGESYYLVTSNDEAPCRQSGQLIDWMLEQFIAAKQHEPVLMRVEN
jgi:LysR family transcriptional regulator, glycine cleavage system transcriptional activator